MKLHLIGLLLASASTMTFAQEKSVRPGVNDTFRDPDPRAFTERFEIESREVFAKRKEILEAIELKPTDVVADVGAGTGLFTRLFASNLGPEGRVIAVDIAQLKENYMVVFARAEQQMAVVEDQSPAGRGRGRRMGAGRGPGGGRGLGAGRGMGTDAAIRVDQDVFHYLLERHQLIRREVKNLDNGVETITESDDKAVASMIQEHVAAMHKRVKTGRGLRFWDDLFVAIFKDHAKIKMVVENTEHGVRVTETSDDAYTVKLIQAHAVVVSRFVKRGFAEAHENHSVPAVDPASTSAPSPATPPVADPNLLFPIIEGHGGVVAVADAVEPPGSFAQTRGASIQGSSEPANRREFRELRTSACGHGDVVSTKGDPFATGK